MAKWKKVKNPPKKNKYRLSGKPLRIRQKISHRVMGLRPKARAVMNLFHLIRPSVFFCSNLWQFVILLSMTAVQQNGSHCDYILTIFLHKQSQWVKLFYLRELHTFTQGNSLRVLVQGLRGSTRFWDILAVLADTEPP